MPLYKRVIGEGYILGVWKTDESFAELSSLLLHPEKYLLDIQALKSPARQLERLAVRVLLYLLTAEEKEILYRPDGSPYLAGDDLFISISHTKGYVAVILGSEDGLGIDIEYYSERIHKVTGKYLHESEQLLLCHDDLDLTRQLLLYWSAKETLFKSIRCEGVDFCEHLRISPFRMQEKGTFGAQELRTPLHRFFAVEYIVNQDFVLTWTCMNRHEN